MVNTIQRGKKVHLFRAQCKNCESYLEYARHDVIPVFGGIKNGFPVNDGFVTCSECGRRVEVKVDG